MQECIEIVGNLQHAVLVNEGRFGQVASKNCMSTNTGNFGLMHTGGTIPWMARSARLWVSDLSDSRNAHYAYGLRRHEGQKQHPTGTADPQRV